VSDTGMSVAEGAEPRPAATETVPGWIVALMRVVVTLWAALVFIQPVLAGQFLDGNDDLVAVHGMNAAFVLLIALVMLIGAVLLWRPGHGAAWPIGATALLLILVFAQSVLGGSGLLAVHVPLGVLLFGSAVAMLGWVWSRRIRVRRSRRARVGGMSPTGC
jgi:hypothetical protein